MELLLAVILLPGLLAFFGHTRGALLVPVVLAVGYAVTAITEAQRDHHEANPELALLFGAGLVAASLVTLLLGRALRNWRRSG